MSQVLVITHPSRLTKDMRDSIYERVQTIVGPETKVVVLDGGLQAYILETRDELDVG